MRIAIAFSLHISLYYDPYYFAVTKPLMNIYCCCSMPHGQVEKENADVHAQHEEASDLDATQHLKILPPILGKCLFQSDERRERFCLQTTMASVFRFADVGQRAAKLCAGRNAKNEAKKSYDLEKPI